MKYFGSLFKMISVCFLLSGNLTYAQDPAQYGTPYSGVPDPRDANIYQVGVGEFSSTRNLQGVINRLDSIKSLGINVIYLMPIYPIGILNASGSPYCIQDFKGINTSMGSITDLRNLVSQAHSLGMAVILDWVANQTSWDHPWITAYPSFYIQNSSGVIQQAGTFSDCAALNYSNPVMTDSMINCMRYWIFAANIDGYRCDWADNAPEAYWSTIISNLRGISTHKILMLAEGSNDGTQDGCTTCGQNQPGYHYAEGFDYIFGENYYWNVTKQIYLDGAAATVVDAANTADYVGASSTQMVARYMTNHDEYGSDGSPFTWMGGAAPVLADFVVSCYMKGIPFIYNGEEVGNTSSLVYPWNTGSINWTENFSVETAMKQILAFRNSSLAIRQGTLTSYDTQNVIAFTKTSGTQNVFVMVNVRSSNESFTLPSGIANTTMYDAFTNQSVSLGTTVTLTPNQYLVYTNSIVNVTGVSVSPSTISIAGTGTQQLTATVSPSNATNQTVNWTSSNAAVATVNAEGLVTGISAGTATITASTVSGSFTSSSAVTVTNVAPTSLTLSPNSASITNISTEQLTATISPTNATNVSVTWSSSNSAVATVSTTGLVSGIAAGSATITANCGSLSATAVITVTAVPKFTVYFYDPSSWGTSINIYWWSALPAGNLADGSWPGVAMTLANGWYSYTFTNITSTNLIFNDGTNQTANLSRGSNGWYYNGNWYNSQPIFVTGVSLSSSSLSLTAGVSQQLTATITPSNASNDTVSWSSSNTAIATVSSTGLVTAVASGNVTITVTTKDQSKTATCTVTVNASSGGTVAVTGISLNSTTASVNVGSTDQLTATIVPSNATNQSVTWSSSNTSVATVSSTGLITPVAAGTANITASSASGTYTATCTVTVGSVTTYYQILNRWQTTTYLKDGSTGKVIYGTNPSNSDFTYQWAEVPVSGGYVQLQNRATGNYIHIEDLNGSVECGTIQSSWYSSMWTLASAGSGWDYIENRWQTGDWIHIQDLLGYAEYEGPSTAWYSAMWEFVPVSTATTVAVTGISLSPTTASIIIGSTDQLSATIAPSNATIQTVTWSSSNTAVATVSAGGLVTAVSAGTATITATTTSGSFTSSCAVTVNDVAVTGVSLSPITASLNVGATDQLNATISPSNATIQTVTWSSSNTAVATVSAGGLVTAVSAGNATITATTNSGSYTSSCAVTVNTIAVTGISISSASAAINVGSTNQLSATITPSNAANQTVTWSSSNTTVASVSASGLVTGNSVGSATITVTSVSGGFTATCAITVNTAVTYYQIVNRWQTTTYLNDAGTGAVTYGTNPASTDYTYQWIQVPVSGYVQFQNRFTGNYMHIEDLNGKVECGAIQESWYSAMWSVVSAGSGWDYIENRWQSSDWIHIQDLLGYAEYSGANSAWWSAMWEIVPVSTTATTSDDIAALNLPATDSVTQNAKVEFYPNPLPSGQSLNIQLSGIPENEKITLTFYDLSGKVLTQKIICESGPIELNLPIGMYVITIRSNKIFSIEKLLVD